MSADHLDEVVVLEGDHDAPSADGPLDAPLDAGAPDASEPDALETDESLAYLLARLALVEQRARQLLVEQDDDGDDGTDTVDEDDLLDPDEVDLIAELALDRGHRVRLRELATVAGLDRLDEDLLLAAAAPAVAPELGDLYAALLGDDRARHATVGLALQLAGAPVFASACRARLRPASPLLAHGLVEVDQDGHNFIDRVVRVPDRVVEHLLGDDRVDRVLAPLTTHPPVVPNSATERILRLLQSGADTVHLLDRHGLGGASAAAAAFTRWGRPCLVLDLSLLGADTSPTVIAEAAAREAALTSAGLVLGPVEALVERGGEAVRAFTDRPTPMVLVGTAAWDPAWAQAPVATLTADPPSSDSRREQWQRALADLDVETDPDAVEASAGLHLTPWQIHRAASAARQHAIADGGPIGVEQVQRGIRAQNAAGLQRLARRVEPKVAWDDLVLPPRVDAQLRELPVRWRQRDRVRQDWGMGRGVANGRGVSALFAGRSGTGKTLAAEVVAGELGLDLYVVDLSTIIDKYIGETSKNLDRIFREADRVNGVLLFDEADALFGKRSAVSDARDRHANVEVAFLLQRMESFDGVAILTTNLASNLDEAFLRRLDVIVDFPAPSVEQRTAMWGAKLSRGQPCAGDVDVDELARLFELSGAEITNAVVSACYRVADEDRPLHQRDLVAAVVREHRKIGRHLGRSDLGPYADLLDELS